MALRELYFLAVDGDRSISIELFNSVGEAYEAILKYVWDHWKDVFYDRERPASANDVTDDDIEDFTNRLANTSHPVYFEVDKAEVPLPDHVRTHQVVSLLGEGIEVTPNVGKEGYTILLPNIGMKDLELQISEIVKHLPESSDAWTLIDLLRDTVSEYKQYQKENPEWEK